MFPRCLRAPWAVLAGLAGVVDNEVAHSGGALVPRFTASRFSLGAFGRRGWSWLAWLMMKLPTRGGCLVPRFPSSRWARGAFGCRAWSWLAWLIMKLPTRGGP